MAEDDREHSPRLDPEDARQGQIIRKRPMTRVLGASLVLVIAGFVIAYLFFFYF